MDEYTKIREAGPGEIIPLVREIDIKCPVEFFTKLSDYGRKQDSCLFESREHLAEFDVGALSFGTANPALYLTGTGAEFSIKALTATGRRMVKYLAGLEGKFDFCESVDYCEDGISGRLKHSEQMVDEESRLKSVNQMDVLRAVAFSFELASKPFRVTCGLLGALSYDFIDQFEKLPANKEDVLGNPDYELYFADNIFLVDHKESKGYVIVNALITDDSSEDVIKGVEDCFDYYFEAAKGERPVGHEYTGQVGDLNGSFEKLSAV